MGLSKAYLSPNTEDVPFSSKLLADSLLEQIPELVFVYLMGSSAQAQVVRVGSDLDLAGYFSVELDLALRARVEEAVEGLVPGVRLDLGILNGADPVYRFEALKGQLLFTRNQETWLKFYSLTCREYEDQMYHYEKQLAYRREAKNL